MPWRLRSSAMRALVAYRWERLALPNKQYTAVMRKSTRPIRKPEVVGLDRGAERVDGGVTRQVVDPHHVSGCRPLVLALADPVALREGLSGRGVVFHVQIMRSRSTPAPRPAVDVLADDPRGRGYAFGGEAPADSQINIAAHQGESDGDQQDRDQDRLGARCRR
jgi:hypothetical protein